MIINIVVQLFALEMHRLQFSWPIPIFVFSKCDMAIPIFHLNNSQNKVLRDWKEVEITINWKVAVYN